MKRKLFKALIATGVCLLIVVLAIAALPLWFPWVAGALASRAGLKYERYERIGYSRLRLLNASYATSDAKIHAGSIELLTPVAWVLGLRDSKPGRPFILLSDWSIDVRPRSAISTPPASQPQRRHAGKQTTANLFQAVQKLNRWAPKGVLTNGMIPAFGRSTRVPKLSWADGQLTGLVEMQEPAWTAEVSATMAGWPHVVRADVPALSTIAELSFTTNRSGIHLSGSVLWRSNCAYVTAQLPSDGIVPQMAGLTATNFSIPSAVTRLPPWGDVRGNLHGVWQNGAFVFQADAAASPADTNMPALEAQLELTGTTNSAVVRRAEVTAPGLRVELSRNIAVQFKPPYLVDPAQLTASVDFEKLGLEPGSGRAQAHLFLRPGQSSIPVATFHLKGQGFRRGDVTVSSVQTGGILAWPNLELHDLEAILWPGTYARFNGELNLTNRNLVRASYHLESEKVPEFLAAKLSTLSWAKMSVSGGASGQPGALAHTGKLVAAEVRYGKRWPAALELSWKGRETTFDSFQLRAETPTNKLTLKGSGSLVGRRVGARLEAMTLSQQGSNVLDLVEPFECRYAAGDDSRWTLQLTPMRLSGSGGDLRLSANLDWPRLGSLDANVTGLSSQLTGEFVSLPEFTLETITLGASWSNSPAAFHLAAVIRSGLTNFPFTIEARAKGGGEGIQVEQAAVVASNAPVALLSGSLPIIIHPGKSQLVAMPKDGPLNGRAEVQPHPFVWDRLAYWSGWKVENPELIAHFAGSWSAPEGRMQFRAGRILQLKTNDNLPKIGPIDLRLSADAGSLRMDRLVAEVGGQKLEASARLPMRPMPQRRVQDLLDPQQLSGNIRVSGGSMSAVSVLAPKVLAPIGTVNLDMEVLPGFRLSGMLDIAGAQTLPIGTLGAARDINLQARFQDRSALLESGRLRLGGVPINLGGRADFALTNLALTEFSVSAQGSKVPLARQPQAIIRADLDVLIRRTNAAKPIITGKVQMRDSFYLSDLASLIPGKVANPNERPPYFSIPDKPIAAWRLDLAVSGDRGLRVRTPVVAGEASPNMRLTGTLENPVATGDIRVDSGKVRFPFGSLEIQQGLVTATAQDPAHPRINVHATARKYGYDVRLDVTGTLQAPLLRFSSTPPLSSDQVLMMLTAGETPKGAGSLSSEQRAQAVAMFLGRDLLAKLGFGEGAAERLIIQSGREFSEEGRPTYDVEFRLNDRWSLTGEYDRFGDYNAGVKWRVFSK